MERVTMVDYECGDEYELANLFMHWGAKGYKKAYPLEEYDMKMMLTTGQINFDFWDDEDIAKMAKILSKMKKGEQKEYTTQNGDFCLLIKEER